jgi:hypothetical protein
MTAPYQQGLLHHVADNCDIDGWAIRKPFLQASARDARVVPHFDVTQFDSVTIQPRRVLGLVTCFSTTFVDFAKGGYSAYLVAWGKTGFDVLLHHTSTNAFGFRFRTDTFGDIYLPNRIVPEQHCVQPIRSLPRLMTWSPSEVVLDNYDWHMHVGCR